LVFMDSRISQGWVGLKCLFTRARTHCFQYFLCVISTE
jgi:hypothetical protein